MRSRILTVLNDGVELASRINESVPENRHRREVTRIVHLTSQSEDGLGSPDLIESQFQKWIRDHASQQVRLGEIDRFFLFLVSASDIPSRIPSRFVHGGRGNPHWRWAIDPSDFFGLNCCLPRLALFNLTGDSISNPLCCFQNEMTALVVYDTGTDSTTANGEETKLAITDPVDDTV